MKKKKEKYFDWRGLGKRARSVKVIRLKERVMMKTIIVSLLVAGSFFHSGGFGFAGQLDAKTEQALLDAIQDEYKARALYQKVIDKFGEVRPFSNIIRAEERHIRELLPLFAKYNVDVPPDEWPDKVPEFATLREACEAGVKAEIDNAKLYDEFFGFVREQDVLMVFKNLRDASQLRHLPAFQRCAEREASRRGRGGWGAGKDGGRNRR
jgi:hypothetical protein